MKFSTQIVFLLSAFGGAKQANARSRHRHLNDVIKGEDESSMSYASMSYASTLYAAKKSTTSRSKSSPTAAPSPTPPVVCNIMCISCVSLDLSRTFNDIS